MRQFGNVTEDATINRDDLVGECEVQPLRYEFWAAQLAEAKTNLERAKSNYSAVTARQSLHYRRNPPTDIKVTEDVIKALVSIDGDVQKAEEELNSAQEAVNTLYAASNTMEMCKSSLDNMVKLQTMRYYGEKESLYEDSINKMKGDYK